MADFADIDTADQTEKIGGQKDNFLFGTLIFLLRDYQASSTYGEDTGYFSTIVCIYEISFIRNHQAIAVFWLDEKKFCYVHFFAYNKYNYCEIVYYIT